jgi:hypothetical protein
MKIAGSQVRIRTFEASALALGGDADVLADTALDASEDTEVLAAGLDGQPDVARNVTVKGNDANVTGDVVVEGFDLNGAIISETIALNGATLVAGNRAFAEVTAVTLPPYDTADTERVRIGLGAKIGLPVHLARDTVIAAFLDGAREATRPTVATSLAALSGNTVILQTLGDRRGMVMA